MAKPTELVVATETSAAGTYHTEVLADTPLAFWSLDEPSGDFLDSTVGARDLTANVGSGELVRDLPGFVTGSRSARFLGGATASRAHDAQLRLEGSFAVECLVKVTRGTSGTPSLLRKGAGTSSGQWNLYYTASTGIVSFRRDNANRAGPAAMRLLTGVIRHLGVDFNAPLKQLRWIVNGEVAQTVSNVTFATGTADTSVFEVMSAAGDDHWFAAVALYDHSLLTARWQSHFAAVRDPGPSLWVSPTPSRLA